MGASCLEGSSKRKVGAGNSKESVVQRKQRSRQTVQRKRHREEEDDGINTAFQYFRTVLCTSLYVNEVVAGEWNSDVVNGGDGHLSCGLEDDAKQWQEG